MGLERLLALIKQACPGRAPSLEAVCATGLMQILLSEHLQRGGQDPRSNQVSDLIAQGAPLLQTAEEFRNPKMSRPHVLYANEALAREASLRAATKAPRLNSAERNQFLRESMRAFKTLPESKQHRHIARASALQNRWGVRGEEPANIVSQSYRGILSKGSLEFPVSPSSLQEALRDHLQIPRSSPLPGFSSVAGRLRELSDEVLFVKNKQRIPYTEEFGYRHTCWSRFFGLCKERDAGQLAHFLRVGAELHKSFTQGMWIKLARTTATGTDDSFVYMALKRPRAPKIAVFCHVDSINDILTLRTEGNVLAFATHNQLARALVGSSADVLTITCTPLDVSCVQNSLVSVRTVAQRDAVQVFGRRREPKKRKIDKPPTPERELLFETAAFGAAEKQKKRFELPSLFGGAPAVGGPVVPNREAEESPESEPEAVSDGVESDRSAASSGSARSWLLRTHTVDAEKSVVRLPRISRSHAEPVPAGPLAGLPSLDALLDPSVQPPGTGAASSSSGPVPPPLELPPAAVQPPGTGAASSGPVPPPPEPPPAARLPRKSDKGIKFGPFAYAPIDRDGVRTGWGMTCGIHFDATYPNRVCKKTLSLGTASRGTELSDEQCVIQLKRWVLKGLLIPDRGNPKAHAQHKEVDARDECAVGIPPEQLHEQLVVLLSSWSAREFP